MNREMSMRLKLPPQSQQIQRRFARPATGDIRRRRRAVALWDHRVRQQVETIVFDPIVVEAPLVLVALDVVDSASGVAQHAQDVLTYGTSWHAVADGAFPDVLDSELEAVWAYRGDAVGWVVRMGWGAEGPLRGKLLARGRVTGTWGWRCVFMI